MRNLLTTTAAMALAIPMLAPITAHAQEQAGQPPVTAGATTQSAPGQSSRNAANPTEATQTTAATGLGDIIVTAQRRSESVQRAAVAISVVGGAQLLASGISQEDRLQQLVPALTIEQVGPSTASFVRGVGNFSVSLTSDPAVAFNYDGVYIGRLTASSTTFYDLDRVEVLKGPQGTLYGRNATAGAINILPTQPKIGELSGYGTVSYGAYNAFSGEGAVNVPIGENGAARISGIYNHRNGYESDGTSDDKSEGARIQLKANLTPDLTARVSFDYAHLGGRGEGITYFNTYACSAATPSTFGITPHCTVTPTGIPRSSGNESAQSQAFWQSLPSGVAGRLRDPFPTIFQNSRFYGATGDVTWKTDLGTLTVIPSVRFDHVVNLNAGGGFPIANNQKDLQYSTEARFAGKVSLFDYTLGFYYFHEDANLQTGATTSNTSENFQAPEVQDTNSYAPFARITANLSSRFRIVGGVRYTHDQKNFTDHAITIAEVCGVAACPGATLPTTVTNVAELNIPFPGTQSASPLVPVIIPGPTAGTLVRRTDIFFNNALSFGKVTYRGAAEFDLTPRSLLYASIESGFRSGGFSTGVGFETFQPEYITAYTVGSKNRFLDNRIRLNLEGFYWIYRNEQVAHALFDNLGRPGSYTQNIGRSLIKGVEAEGQFLVTPTTLLSADVQYLDAYATNFTYTTVGYPVTNCPVTPTASPITFSVNCAGFPGYNAPKITLNLAGQQTVPIGDYQLVLSADTQHKSGRFTYFDYATEQFQPSSWTTNAQVSFGPADGRWTLSGYVRNIENDRLLAAPVAVFGLVAGYTSPPRTYGGRFSVKF